MHDFDLSPAERFTHMAECVAVAAAGEDSLKKLQSLISDTSWHRQFLNDTAIEQLLELRARLGLPRRACREIEHQTAAARFPSAAPALWGFFGRAEVLLRKAAPACWRVSAS
jgi:hypothetical protein